MISLINDDCLNVLDDIEPNSVDLIFADPPFNLNKEYEKNMSTSEYYNWCFLWIEKGWRILKPTGSFFIMNAVDHIGQMQVFCNEFGIFRNQIIWLNSSMPVKTKFCQGYQPILWYTKTENYTFNYGAQKRVSTAAIPYGKKNTAGSIKDIWDDIPFISGGCMASKEAILRDGSKRKFHPAQMPVALGSRIILYCSNERDHIVDLFAGIASMGVACQRLKRNYTGIEIKKEYYEKAIQRLGL